MPHPAVYVVRHLLPAIFQNKLRQGQRRLDLVCPRLDKLLIVHKLLLLFTVLYPFLCKHPERLLQNLMPRLIRHSQKLLLFVFSLSFQEILRRTEPHIYPYLVNGVT